MKKHFWKTAIITMGLALCVAPGAGAGAYTATFFGEDLSLNGSPVTLWSNAAGQATAFQSALQSKFLTRGTEDFTGTSGVNPLLTFTNGNTGTILGEAATRSVTTPSTDGRYAISSPRYLDATKSFTITFANAISALGFYATDVGDFQGGFYLDLYTNADDTTAISSILVRNTQETTSASVLYFGFLDTTQSYQKITFRNTANEWDAFGFDDITIASTPVPLPPSALMLGSGLLGLVGLLKTRRRPQ